MKTLAVTGVIAGAVGGIAVAAPNSQRNAAPAAKAAAPAAPIGAADSASAAGFPRSCKLGTICVYEHANFKGRKATYKGPSNGRSRCYNLPDQWDREISSAANATSLDLDANPRDMHFYSHRNCRKGGYSLRTLKQGGTTYPKFSKWDMNDMFRSVEISRRYH